MDDFTEQPPALDSYELIYAPAYKASGAPLRADCSRQELKERQTERVQALTADAATARFERERDRMVTACTLAPLGPLAMGVAAIHAIRQRGSASLHAMTWCAVIAIALVLGWLGPAIDAQPDRRGEWLQAERELQQEGALDLWEAEARATCQRIGGENAGYLQVAGGGIACTNKRGQLLAQKGRP